MMLQFQAPVYCSMGSLIIASKLEEVSKEVLAGSSSSCRLAFYGPLKASLAADSPLDALRLFRWKQKTCEVHRAVDIRVADGLCFEAIGWKLYSKNASIKPFLGLKLEKESGEVVGIIHGPFGSTDKFKIRFPNGVSGVTSGMKLLLRFKRYVYDSDKSMKQRGIELPEGSYDDMSAPVVVDIEADAVEGGEKGEEDIPHEELDADSADAAPSHSAGTTSIQETKLPVGVSISKKTIPVEQEQPRAASNKPLPPGHEKITKSPSKPSVVEKKLPDKADKPPPAPASKSSLDDGKSTPKYAPLDLTGFGMKKAVSSSVKGGKSSEASAGQASPSTAATANISSLTRIKPNVPIPVPVPTTALSSPRGTAGPGKGGISVKPSSGAVRGSGTSAAAATGEAKENAETNRRGTVESIKASPSGENVAIVSGAFRMEENIRLHIGATVTLDGKEVGQLVGPFAKLGKCKVNINNSAEVSVGVTVEIALK